MKGVLTFQISNPDGTQTCTDSVSREEMLQQLSQLRALHWKSHCIYHLDGSITIIMSMQHGTRYTSTITGSFKRL